MQSQRLNQIFKKSSNLIMIVDEMDYSIDQTNDSNNLNLQKPWLNKMELIEKIKEGQINSIYSLIKYF